MQSSVAKFHAKSKQKWAGKESKTRELYTRLDKRAQHLTVSRTVKEREVPTAPTMPDPVPESARLAVLTTRARTSEDGPSRSSAMSHELRLDRWGPILHDKDGKQRQQNIWSTAW